MVRALYFYLLLLWRRGLSTKTFSTTGTGAPGDGGAGFRMRRVAFRTAERAAFLSVIVPHRCVRLVSSAC